MWDRVIFTDEKRFNLVGNDAVDSGTMDLEVFSNLLHLLTISEGFLDFCADEAFFPLSSHDFN